MIESLTSEEVVFRKKHQMAWVYMDEERRLVDFDIDLQKLDERVEVSDGSDGGAFFRLWYIPPIGEKCLFTKDDEKDQKRVMKLPYTVFTKRGRKYTMYFNKK